MSKDNIRKCDVVQDLLPLYYDDACSDSSRELVEAHLEDCEKCRRTYEELKNETIDTMIKEESQGVLERHEKKERTAAYKAGVIIAGLLLIPVFVTFIVGLASGGDMNVFALVAASMLLVGAITVVPLVSRQKKFVKCILCSVVALLFILFFVDRMNGGGEFIFWSVPTVFGISIVLFPFVIRAVDLPPVLADKKALITMMWNTLWLFLTIVETCGHSQDMQGMKTGCIVAFVVMLGVWLVFFVARYAKTNAWIKAGCIVLICTLWTAFANDICMFLIEGERRLTIRYAEFSNWSTDLRVNANVYTIVLIAGGAAAIFLMVIGLIRKNKKALPESKYQKRNIQNEKNME